ncbi:uncharacterized protein LOC122201802 [Panthera leo]|uniref:uncharacterized protein LOC122201802 n=1 Tax=Panthera leo TaxID=9689 RepID=UPI001C6A7F3A|nr:uncharacterized protein LOC122201802 [Panthera leo]
MADVKLLLTLLLSVVPNYTKPTAKPPTPAQKFKRLLSEFTGPERLFKLPISHSYSKSAAFLLTKTITHKVFTFKRNVRKIKPSGKSVRTLFEVPNLEYKGRLSVLYSSPETFRLSSCPRDRRAKESTPLPPAPPIFPSGSQAWLRNRRHRAAELQRRPSASFVLDLGVERLRRHWLSSPSSSLSHLGNLRQKSLAVPPAQGSPAETAEYRDQRNSGEDLVGGHNERKMKKERIWKYPHSPEENKTTNM